MQPRLSVKVRSARASRLAALTTVLLTSLLPIVACSSVRTTPVTARQSLAARRATLNELGLVPTSASTSRVRLSLPTSAAGAVRLTDESRQLETTFGLRGTSDVAAVSAKGVALYQGAIAGADLVHATLVDGVEDFVFFDEKPEREELVYELDVSHVAGLRMVDGSLEMLDPGGAPRLRAAAPFVVDAHGSRIAAKVALKGCAFDASPAAPWGRRVVSPGASTCLLHVTWGGAAAAEDIAYPAIVDPAWQGTASPQGPRYGHASLTLAGGKILIAGGFYEPDGGMGRGALASADLFDPITRTWANAGSFVNPRQDLALGPLPSGKVLVIGGNGSSKPDIYTGVGFSRSNEFVAQPVGLTATLLANGKLLVAGGSTGAPVKTALLYDEPSDTFGNAGPTGELGIARDHHTATKLASGKVLFAGGNGAGGPLASAELYDPTTNTFAPTAGPMASARSSHVAVLLPDGRVLVAGGGTTSAELYDPATSTWSLAGPLSSARRSLQAVLLGSGRVMVAGGESAGSAVGDVEIFDPKTKTFSAQPSLSFARSELTLARVGADEVIVVGGKAPNGTSVRNAESWKPLEKGTSCLTGDDCGSGVCQEGVCCAGPCAGPCKTCAVGTGACVAVLRADDPDECTGKTTCDSVGACKKKDGQSCGAAGDCASGFCVDGFCCEKACNGQCEACDVVAHEGRCIPVAGESHGARPRCAPAAPPTPPANDTATAKCGGTCNGVSVGCAFPSAVTTCAQTCTSKLTTISTCDGRGACVLGSPQSCPGNFVCADATSCKTECTENTDCLDGYRCENKRCNAIALCKGSVVTKGTERIDCAPYTCEQSGVCRTSCASVSECAEPSLCSVDGVCIRAPEPLTASCSVGRASGSGGPGAPWALVALAMTGLAFVRRRP